MAKAFEGSSPSLGANWAYSLIVERQTVDVGSPIFYLIGVVDYQGMHPAVYRI